MDARKARHAFEEHLAAHGATVTRLVPSQGVSLMISFFRDQRPPADVEDDLLCQWGTFDWGSGEFFEFDITRQFILDGMAEDENIWQLHLTFKYKPTDQLRTLESGDKWCGTTEPRGIDNFAQWIEKSPAFQAVSETEPDEIELDYECAG